jgi:hypothetical protein
MQFHQQNLDLLFLHLQFFLHLFHHHHHYHHFELQFDKLHHLLLL